MTSLQVVPGDGDDLLPVSVVIPVRNGPQHVRAAIRSAQNQEPAPPAEIVVVDDASEDDTADVAESLGARVIRLPERLGAGGARNVGIREARCPWIAFLDADDAWLPAHLGRLWSLRNDFALVADSGVGSATNRIYGHGGRRPVELVSPRQVIFPANCVQPTGALVRRDVLLEVGGFASAGLSEDMDTWIRVLERGRGLLVPSIGWSYREHESQTSGDRAGMQASELAVVKRYESRPWFGEELLRWIEVRHHWERLVSAAHERDRAALTRETAWLACRPNSITALLPVVRMRQRLRRHQLDRGAQGWVSKSSGNRTDPLSL